MTLEYITEKNAPTEAEIVQYMKLPLVLFKTAGFKEELSLAAKVLYCFLLDRSNLSLKNADRFTDKNGRALSTFLGTKPWTPCSVPDRKSARLSRNWYIPV